ncbi:MAG: hypothetical protein ABI120_13705 [Gemmatimonadaceae bacterium]
MSGTKWHALREMVVRWARTAAQVERGYALTFDDYLNDLDLRRLIDERIREIGVARDDALPASLRIALAAADDQFRRATIASEENVWGAENESDAGWTAEREWYYYRTPKRSGDSW